MMRFLFFFFLLTCFFMLSCSQISEPHKANTEKVSTPEPLDPIPFCELALDQLPVQDRYRFQVDSLLLLPRQKTTSPLHSLEFISSQYPAMHGYSSNPATLKEYLTDQAVWKIKLNKEDGCAFVLFEEIDFDGIHHSVFLFNVGENDSIRSVYLLAAKESPAECIIIEQKVEMDALGNMVRYSHSNCYHEEEGFQGGEEMFITDSLHIDFTTQNEQIFYSDTVVKRTPVSE